MNKISGELLRFNKRLVLNKTEKTIISACYSTKPAIHRLENDELREKIKDTERVASLSRKPRVKKPQKPPFAKNLFIGQFDCDILTYPQLEKDELETLESSLKPVADFFNLKETAETKTFSKQFAQNLEHLSLFGLKTPVSVGGRELTHTEACKFNEIISKHELGRNLIYNEDFGIQATLKHGSDALKRKYLDGLVSGKFLSAFCFAEEGGYDPKSVKTKAIKNPDGSWTLNGTKSWVINGSIADLFIVIAETDRIHKDDLVESMCTAFIVEKQFGGVTIQKTDTLLDSDITDVQFNNTSVPAENVLGVELRSEDVVSSILPETRLSTGASCATLMRELISKYTEYCKNISIGGTNLIETDTALTKIGDLVSTAYAIESVTYLTSLLMDHYEKQDLEVEAAIVKAFSSEQTVQASLLVMDFFGTPSLVKNHWLNRIHREALGYSLLTESNETLKLLIALLGVQHVGKEIHKHIKELRNPFFYPWKALKRMWIVRKQEEDNPSLNLNLNVYLHPSIRESADILEYCVLRLQYASELILLRQGIEVVNDHQNLKRLAECVIDIYAMTACVGRASRSYSIGLRNADLELIVATTFCIKAKERVRDRVAKIWQGRFNTGDQNKKVLADTVGRQNGYCFEHPLARNY